MNCFVFFLVQEEDFSLWDFNDLMGKFEEE